MQDLNFRAPPALAIAEGATTPNPGVAGVIAWSTTLSRHVIWTGSSWNALMGRAVLGHWPAAAIKPCTTNGCAALVYDESATNKVMTGALAFDASAIEYAQFSFKAPKALDEGTLSAVLEWAEAASATSHDCMWQIELQAQGDADTIDSAWGTAVTVIDTGTSGTRRMTAETSAITPGGGWAAGDEIIVRISRKATDVADTLNVDAKLIGVTLYATYNTAVEP